MTVPRNQVLLGDSAVVLQTLPASSVDMALTSPPYFRLRDYGRADQLGSEATTEQWVDALLRVADEVARVLMPTGTFWLNVGDSYARHARDGAPTKSLLLGPERLALRLIERGWLIRNKVVWHKTNPMPSSVPDRFACTWEYLFVLTRSARYYFDLDAVRVPHVSHPDKRHRVTAAVHGRPASRGSHSASIAGLAALKAAGLVGHPLGKNPGDVLRSASSNYRGAHPATFPLTLAEHAIRTACPERRCRRCTAPWRRSVLRSADGTARRARLAPTCSCTVGHEPGIVLDPFMGAGTTALAAERLNRHWLGIELNPDYIALTDDRLAEARGAPIRAA
jgi:DNA modification methylase